MAKKGRTSKSAYRQKYEIFIYRPHPSGIGQTYVKAIDIYEKPTYDNCDFFDVTNGKFARWENESQRKSMRIKETATVTREEE